MQNILLPKSFVDALHKKEDKVFLYKLQKVFKECNKKITSTDDALFLMEKSLNVDLNEKLYAFLDEVEQNEKAFVYDLLIVSKFSPKRLAESLIKDIYMICNKSELNVEDENIVWFFCDDLRKLRQFCFLEDYIKILNIKKLGIARQPIVELVSHSRNKEIVEELIPHLNDIQINGHILLALKNLQYNDLGKVAGMFLNDEREWVSGVAKKIIK